MIVSLVLGAVLGAAVPTVGGDGLDRVFSKGNVTVALGKAVGGCEAGEREAAWLEPGKVVRGCWHQTHDTVWIWWEDGDRSAVPADIFSAPPTI